MRIRMNPLPLSPFEFGGNQLNNRVESPPRHTYIQVFFRPANFSRLNTQEYTYKINLSNAPLYLNQNRD